MTADFFRTLFWTSKSAKTIHEQSVVVVGSKRFCHHVPIPQGSLNDPFPSWGTGRDDCKIRIAERTNQNHSFDSRLIYQIRPYMIQSLNQVLYRKIRPLSLYKVKRRL